MTISRITTIKLRETVARYSSIPKVASINKLVNCAMKKMAGKECRKEGLCL